MKATITSIELKSALKFFPLSLSAMAIVKQLQPARCREFKKQGFWTKHYTMSLWNSEEDLRRFTSSGAHLEAMKKSATIAKEIRTFTLDADSLPTWKEAKHLLMTKGKVIRY